MNIIGMENRDTFWLREANKACAMQEKESACKIYEYTKGHQYRYGLQWYNFTSFSLKLNEEKKIDRPVSE
jgi:hypothetical protein